MSVDPFDQLLHVMVIPYTLHPSIPTSIIYIYSRYTHITCTTHPHYAERCEKKKERKSRKRKNERESKTHINIIPLTSKRIRTREREKREKREKELKGKEKCLFVTVFEKFLPK